MTEDAGRGVAIVIGAERISGPFPELCFCLYRRSADQRKNGSWPHVCKLLLTSSGPRLAGLATLLQPKWWSQSEAPYARLRAAKAASARSRGVA